MNNNEHSRLEDFLKKEIRDKREIFPVDEAYFDGLHEKINHKNNLKPERNLKVIYIAWTASAAAVIAILMLVFLQSKEPSRFTDNSQPMELPVTIMTERPAPELKDVSFPDSKSVEAILVMENIPVEMIAEPERSTSLLDGISKDEIEEYLLTENNLLTEL